MGSCISGTASLSGPVSGSRVGNVVTIGSEAGGDEDDEGFGISFSFRKNFLFLSVTLPVPSTFTVY